MELMGFGLRSLHEKTKSAIHLKPSFLLLCLFRMIILAASLLLACLKLLREIKGN